VKLTINAVVDVHIQGAVRRRRNQEEDDIPVGTRDEVSVYIRRGVRDDGSTQTVRV
jgi:hypothetical protein